VSDLLPLLSALLGVIIGSFLNVVIHRYPLMMIHSWRQEAITYFKLALSPEPNDINLATPRSHCPHCRTPICLWHNIPLLSYLWLVGRCAHCQEPISWRYPFVELLSGLAFFCIAWHWGLSWHSAYAMLFTSLLIIISSIDLEHQLIPDIFSLSLLWLGLVANIQGLFCPLETAVIGALAGYLSLWLFMHAFKLCTGKIGMGHGDFKLLSALCAWLGWHQLPFIVICAALIGSLVGLSLIGSKRIDRDTPIPFGPYLAGAGWVALFMDSNFIDHYLSFMQIY
jgi:leader peptidase (prepilin peptidase) / N-methyltransferase